MNKAIKISSVFPKHLFWDVKLEQLDAERDQDLIVPRALFMTDEESSIQDIEKLELIYSNVEFSKNRRPAFPALSRRKSWTK